MMKKRHVFSRSVLIRTDIAALFHFHLDPRNLPVISPPFPKVTIGYISDIPLKEGSRVTVLLPFLIKSIKWEISIDRVRYPAVISDLQLQGPFHYWIHHHRFQETDGGTVMTDEVEFSTPSVLIPGFLIQGMLQVMFLYRHFKTKKYFESLKQLPHG